MDQGYLIDTNAVIDYLDNKLPDKSASLIDGIIAQISVITRMELLGWTNATIEQIVVLQQFVNASVVFNLDETIIIKTIELRKKHKNKLPDAIIAATAIVHNLTPITSDSHFKNISEFKTIGTNLL